MAATGATLIGGAELKAKFKGMESAMNRDEFINSCEKAAELIRSRALRNAEMFFKPKTGLLFRNFITKRLEPTKNKTGGAMAAVFKRPLIRGKRASHAHLLEYGTVHMPARPYFRIAVDANKHRCARFMMKGAEAAIKAEAREKRHHAILFRSF